MRRLSSLLLSLEHPHPTVDTMVEKFAEWERSCPPRPRWTTRRGSAKSPTIPGASISTTRPTSAPTIRAFRSIGSMTPMPTRYRDESIPPGLRGAAGVGARRLSWRLLRLRDPAPQLRHGPFGQDAVAGRDVPPTDARVDRTAVRHRSLADRPRHRIDGAAAAPRRSALHRRGEHVGVTAGEAGRVSFGRRRKESDT